MSLSLAKQYTCFLSYVILKLCFFTHKKKYFGEVSICRSYFIYTLFRGKSYFICRKLYPIWKFSSGNTCFLSYVILKLCFFTHKKSILGKYLYVGHTLFIRYLEENHTLFAENYTLFGNLAVATLYRRKG